jgi:gamma-glutamyl phosphate reductase
MQEHSKFQCWGHCSGVCNIYVDDVNMAAACAVTSELKTDYPVACNAERRSCSTTAGTSPTASSSALYAS